MFQRYRTTAVLNLLFFVLLAGLFWYVRTNETQAEETHFHAAFQVYRDNALVDFTDEKYMYISPCTDSEESENEQMEKAHLHGNVGDVVHVEQKNGKWKDLFKNLSYDAGSAVVGYVNGERIFGILNKNIRADDRAIFLIGSYDEIEKKLEAVPSVERIREVEQTSEEC